MFKFITRIYWNLIASPYRQALHLGVKIGNDCLIATRNWGSEPYLITIGNNVQITQGCYFHTHGGCHVARKKYKNFDVFGKIIIESDSYIGSGVHIMPGITVGRGSLIAAGAIVTKSVPPHEVWGGIPAKYICSVDEYIERNMPYNLDSKQMSHSEKRKFLESLPEDKFIQK